MNVNLCKVEQLCCKVLEQEAIKSDWKLSYQQLCRVINCARLDVQVTVQIHIELPTLKPCNASTLRDTLLGFPQV